MQWELIASFRFPSAGLVREPQPTVAVAYFRAAADLGHRAAATRVGICFTTGEGARPNPQVARYYLRQAADAGCPEAQCWLAMATLANTRPQDARSCTSSSGSKPNTDEQSKTAAQLWAAAAEAGHARAANNLAVCYLMGESHSSQTDTAPLLLLQRYNNLAG
eukprot:SAG31_NODE_4218_length_3453_cov_2.228682_4_plen_163_part_00